MFGYLLTCVILIALPIIAVQYPRYLDSLHTPPHKRTSSEHAIVETNVDGAGEKTPAPDVSSPEHGSTLSRSVPTTSSGNNHVKKARKPWDPPFPTTRERPKGHSWRILGPATETIAEDTGDGEGERGAENLDAPVEDNGERISANVRATTPLDDPTLPSSLSSLNLNVPESLARLPSCPSKASSALSQSQEPRGHHLSVFRWIVLVLASVIFVFAFAILVGHCLAWFVVYKTESRLGEAKSGLLRGGEMRMCLCARG
ncbi:hypothetical protein CC80DRAFT_284558 [Byssothecium circinans]|uniref:Uncharacterized protein n=1 Tax=Byssothecium circinans TaxID=147558 RepID=A0A6A5U6W2_9PLEO|nr:hypothetical protein CC80DRAFT_284558 [Byssothecium circinans]